MNKLNIAIFHLAFIYSGGGEKLVLQEYDGLKKRGYNVQIFTTVINRKNSFPEVIAKYNIKTFLPQLSAFSGHEAFQTVLSCILAPFFAFKFRKFDAILACNQPSVWIAFLINKMYGVRYVSYLAQPTRFLHQRKVDRETGLFFSKKAEESLSARLMMTTFKSFSDWADRISIKNSYKVLANGAYSKKLLEKVYKISADSCPSGVRPVKNIKLKRSDYLLVTNRHFAQKKLEYAIFALNKIRDKFPNYRLIITGSETNYTRTLKSLVSELGIKDFVEFAGYVKEKDLERLYKNASAYLYTAPEEDFGMGIIEAMGFGAPVIAWKNAGPAGIIDNNVNGLLANPFDINDFVDKLQRIFIDRKYAEKISQNALIKIKTKYSHNIHIDCLEKALFEAKGT
jgi:glycosyltransferase involved in cell wall biosynthesis